jgi:heme-degrading monooxygenase HmoA
MLAVDLPIQEGTHPMIIAALRTRLRPEAQDEYVQWAKRMNDLVVTVPGYISHKSFIAPDGERLLLVEFETEEAIRQWGLHPEHIEAKKLGRQRFFSEYSAQICGLIREAKSKPHAET